MDNYMRKESHKTMKACINSIWINVFIMIIMETKAHISNLDEERGRYTERERERDCFCEWNDICKQFILPGLMWHKLTIAMHSIEKTKITTTKICVSHLIWGVANENRPYRNGGSCLLFVSNKKWRRVYPLHVDQKECPKPRHNLSYQDLLFYPYRYDAFFFIRAVFEYYLTQLSQDHFKNE